MPAQDIDPDRVADWFTHRLGRPVTVHAVEKHPRGVSRETWVARTDRGDYVVRRDLAGGSVDISTLRREYDVYRLLAPTPVRVAQPLWYEDDPRWKPDDREAYVRQHVVGDWRIDGWHAGGSEGAAVRVAAARSHLQALAEVHTLDWRSAGFGELFHVPADAATAGTALIEDTMADIAAIALHTDPLVVECAHRLRLTAPPAPQLCLCKGTNGRGEEVFQGTEVIALSDWELARVGDPAYDLAQCQDLLRPVVVDGEMIWDLDRALDYYHRVSGISVSADNVAWYRAAYNLIMYGFSHHAGRVVVDGRDHLARLAWVSTEMQHRALVGMATATGILPPPEGRE